MPDLRGDDDLRQRGAGRRARRDPHVLGLTAQPVPRARQLHPLGRRRPVFAAVDALHQPPQPRPRAPRRRRRRAAADRPDAAVVGVVGAQAAAAAGLPRGVRGHAGRLRDLGCEGRVRRQPGVHARVVPKILPAVYRYRRRRRELPRPQQGLRVLGGQRRVRLEPRIHDGRVPEGVRALRRRRRTSRPSNRPSRAR